MDKTTRKLFAIALLCVTMCVAFTLPASANSAQTYWEGVSASGVPKAIVRHPITKPNRSDFFGRLLRAISKERIEAFIVHGIA